MANKYPESEDDFIHMQQEAIRRVREMQSRARATLENAGMHIENNDPRPQPSAPVYSAPETHHSPLKEKHEHAEPKVEPVVSEEKHVPHHSTAPLIRVPSFNLSFDSDQVLLIMLIYLLIKDGADKWLILSLAFVLI